MRLMGSECMTLIVDICGDSFDFLEKLLRIEVTIFCFLQIIKSEDNKLSDGGGDVKPFTNKKP